MVDESERRGKDRKDNDAASNKEDGVGRHFERLLRLDEGASRSQSGLTLIGVKRGRGGYFPVAALVGIATVAERPARLRNWRLRPRAIRLARCATTRHNSGDVTIAASERRPACRRASRSQFQI